MSIRRRSKNSWELTIDLGRDADGKRQRKYVNVKGKKADAERRFRELCSQLDKGLPVDDQRLTVADHIYDWHSKYVVTNLRPRTAERYMGDIRNHIVPHLGHLQLSKLSPAHIQNMESVVLESGLSPSSVRHIHRVLSEALKHGMQWGLLWRNPCEAVKPPKQVKKEIKIPDLSRVHQLLELSKATPFFPAFHFLAYTGVRRGEVCGLKWSDIDLENASASINRAAVRIKKQGVSMMPPKTEKSSRLIALDPDTIDVLRSHKGTQLMRTVETDGAFHDQGFVFTSPLGGFLDPDVLTYNWRKLVKQSGSQIIRLHDLRHFHATLLFHANTHPKIVQERLGHSTISITLDTYSHAVPSMQKKAALDFADAMRQDTS